MVEVYAGLDISDKSTHVCVVNGSGDVVWSGACATDPGVIAKTLKARAPGLGRVVLETGTLSSFLYHGLVERGVPVTCICARHGVTELRSYGDTVRNSKLTESQCRCPNVVRRNRPDTPTFQ